MDDIKAKDATIAQMEDIIERVRKESRQDVEDTQQFCEATIDDLKSPQLADFVASTEKTLAEVAKQVRSNAIDSTLAPPLI